MTPLAPTHELKTDPEMFQAAWEHRKTAELRRADRDYQVGNFLLLRETKYTGTQMAAGSPLIYTGRQLLTEITHILHGPRFGLSADSCMLSIRLRDWGANEDLTLGRLRGLRGKDCTYGDVPFRDCPYVQAHMERLQKAQEAAGDAH